MLASKPDLPSISKSALTLHAVRRRSRRGLALFDILLAISAAAVTSVILLHSLSRDFIDRQAAISAEWISTGRSGLELWLIANADSVHKAFDDAGCDGRACRATVDWTGTWSGISLHPAGVPLVKDAGFLPSGMITNGVQQRQLRVALVRRLDRGIEGMVFATGAAFTKEEGWNVARLIGTYGGVMDPDLGISRISGPRREWFINLASGAWTASCVGLGGVSAVCPLPANRDVVAVLSVPKE